MILLIDNYDSFTYNLYQFLGIFDKDIVVVRNDCTNIDTIEQLKSRCDCFISRSKKSKRGRHLP